MGISDTVPDAHRLPPARLRYSPPFPPPPSCARSSTARHSWARCLETTWLKKTPFQAFHDTFITNLVYSTASIYRTPPPSLSPRSLVAAAAAAAAVSDCTSVCQRGSLGKLLIVLFVSFKNTFCRQSHFSSFHPPSFLCFTQCPSNSFASLK